MNKTTFSNNLKRLLNISLLLSIIMFNSINSYASDSLNDYLSNENNTLKFNTNSIENITTVDGSTTTTDVTNNINSGDFIIDSVNNTTFIDVNTIPLLNNTGGGSKGKYNW